MFVTLEYETFYFLMALCIGVGYSKGVPVEFDAKMFRVISMIIVAWYVVLKSFVMIYVILINQ
jgi:hypothetical protein